MGRALNYLQNKNISHNDIKPNNILIKNSIYKICDFGVSFAYISNTHNKKILD